jgi:hypothetical protein
LRYATAALLVALGLPQTQRGRVVASVLALLFAAGDRGRERH